jgi:hypothetical protein
MDIDIRNIEVLDDQMVEVLKTKTPQQRLAIAFGMWSSARKQLTSYLRGRHLDWNEKKIQQEVVKRLSHGAIDIIP